MKGYPFEVAIPPARNAGFLNRFPRQFIDDVEMSIDSGQLDLMLDTKSGNPEVILWNRFTLLFQTEPKPGSARTAIATQGRHKNRVPGVRTVPGVPRRSYRVPIRTNP